MPYEQYVKNNLFEPLGMSASCYTAHEAGPELATGYQAIHTDKGIDDQLLVIRHALDRLGGSFGMTSGRCVTTIEDTVRLMSAAVSSMTHPAGSLSKTPS
jgi:CubicO group peptidase (beta-lactamase class C family)